jgi:hypothetical protein
MGDLTVSDRSSPEEGVANDAYTPRQIKDAALELLKFGLLEASSKPNLYRTATTQRTDIARVLEPLDLALKIDELRGLAYLIVASASDPAGDEWSHPLVRRQRMNLEQSLIVAILRQQFVVHEQEAGVGSTEALLSVEDILPQVQTYLGSLGSDSLEQKRLRNLLDQLKGYGLVSEVDRNDQFYIRPIIAHLANPENLTNLLHAYRSAAARTGVSEEPAKSDAS